MSTRIFETYDPEKIQIRPLKLFLNKLFVHSKRKMSSLSAVVFLDTKGNVILCRDYRGEVDISHCVSFLWAKVSELGEDCPPVWSYEGTNLVLLKHNDIYCTHMSFYMIVIGITLKNANIAISIQYLKTIITVLEEYFRVLEEESLKDNFVLSYELLDEMMDFGFAQITETKVLGEYITQKGFELEPKPVEPPHAATSAVSWRPEGIKHRKNEVYLDVIESVNMLLASNGDVLDCNVQGNVKVKCYLTGMPELKLGLNEKIMLESTGRTTLSSDKATTSIELDDVKFHQCVRLSKFEQERMISFIPPDGEFTLMSYSLPNPDSKPLFWVECIVEKQSETGIEFFVRCRSQFKKRSAANNVEISIPVPEDSDTPRLKASVGSVKYRPERSEISWSVGYFPGGKEFSLKARVGLPSVKLADVDPSRSLRGSAEDIFGTKKPINVTFELPYFTLSGIQVRYLKVTEKSGYAALPWVRYISKNGLYQVRMPDRACQVDSS